MSSRKTLIISKWEIRFGNLGIPNTFTSASTPGLREEVNLTTTRVAVLDDAYLG